MVYKRKISYDWVDWVVEKKEIELKRQELEKKYKSGELIRHVRTPKKPPNSDLVVEKESAYEFYESESWKALRNQFVVEKKHEDKLKCCVCNVDLSEHSIHAKKLKVHINVDHIRKNWERRLDKTNLQILCNSCNWTKGNLDFEDDTKKYRVENFTKIRKENRKKEVQIIDRKLMTHPDIDKVREKYKEPVIVESPEGKKTYRVSKVKQP
jgi:5-methylcytosine-specific restriction endonuclease McrA